MSEKPIAKAWSEFEAGLIERGYKLAQRSDLKTAFYAGANTIWTLNVEIAQRGLSNEAAGEWFLAIQQELDEFVEGCGK
jgi:hypothetical protein